MHKGKLRTKRRLPRKLKKIRKKEMEMYMIKFNEYCEILKKRHGNDWYDYVIFGG